MIRTITKEEFYTVAKIMTVDAFAFLETERGKELHRYNFNPYDYRYLRITPRRRIGKTYAACILANDYSPTLFAFHSEDWMREVVGQPHRHSYCPTNPDYAFTADGILHERFLPTLGERQHARQFAQLPNHFELGIIEDGRAMESKIGPRPMDEVRDRMLATCTLLVEFG